MEAVAVLANEPARSSLVYNSVTVGEHSALCVDYNVSKKSVSVHVPLNRLIAGLFVKSFNLGVSLHFLADPNDSVDATSKHNFRLVSTSGL